MYPNLNIFWSHPMMTHPQHWAVKILYFLKYCSNETILEAAANKQGCAIPGQKCNNHLTMVCSWLSMHVTTLHAPHCHFHCLSYANIHKTRTSVKRVGESLHFLVLVNEKFIGLLYFLFPIISIKAREWI